MPTQNDPTKNPSTISYAYHTMLPRWKKIDTILGGTESMRAAEKEFLPQHVQESDGAYKERLERNVLFNMTELTLEWLVGTPFSQPVQQSEDIPETMQLILKDVDLLGNNVDVFARQWFRDGLAKAFSITMVDHPRVDNQPDRTQADDIAENVRPYWVKIPVENVIFASSEIIDGQERLTHIRLREEIIERVGFAEESRCIIRVLDLVEQGEFLEVGDFIDTSTLQDVQLIESFEESQFVSFDTKKVRVSIYQEDLSKKEDTHERWFLSDVFVMDIDEIPIVIYYSDRDGLLQGKPQILDLADLNIAHWQSASDQRNVLTVARFPILASSGEMGENNLVVGPHSWLNVPDPGGRIYYVEHAGNAIAAGRQDLQDLEAQGAEYGASFLKRQPGSPTATARALDSAEATSPLEDDVIRFNSALAELWRITAKWMRIDPEQTGSIVVNADLAPDIGDQSELSELGNARQRRDLSRRRYLNELVRRSVLSEDFDEEANASELELEERAAFALIPNIDIDPAAEE